MKPTGTAGTFVGEMSPVTGNQGAWATLATSWQVQTQWAGALGREGCVAIVTDQKGRFFFKVSLTSFQPGGYCEEEVTLWQL